MRQYNQEEVQKDIEEDIQEDKENIVAIKNGFPVYVKNPSISKTKLKNKKIQFGDEKQGVIINENDGQVMGNGGAFIYKWTEVDDEQFIKLYTRNSHLLEDLIKPARALLRMIYEQIQNNKNEDEVILTLLSSKMTKAIYYRGLSDLLTRRIIFKSQRGTFFINVQILFNGNKLALINGYFRKGTPHPMRDAMIKTMRESAQLSLL